MQKYSKAEAGKLGSEKSKITASLQKSIRISEYNLQPKKCKQCSNILTYNNRHKIFCNKSCAATFNNLKKGNRKTPTKWNCISCNTEHATVEWRVGKYCNLQCQANYQFTQLIENWLSNKASIGQRTIKRYIIEHDGYRCTECNISDWKNKPITLELEHKDGNSENNTYDNLCLLCPNCHSQTITYKSKNNGNGRHSRRKRYAEGKSY